MDIKLKDDDDEYGVIGEHYIVNCSFGKTKKTCLVNVLEFERWKRKEYPIRWI